MQYRTLLLLLTLTTFHLSADPIPPPSTEETTPTISRSFVVKAGGKLNVDVDIGDFQIVTSDQSKIDVVVKREAPDLKENEITDLLKKYPVSLTQNGNEVLIYSKSTEYSTDGGLFSLLGHQSGRHRLTVHYQVTVPKKFEMQIKTAGGSIEIASLQGKVDTVTAGGSITLTDIQGPVSASTSGGDIKTTRCTGQMVARTSGGSITINEFTGTSVHTETSGGNILTGLDSVPKSNCTFVTTGGNIILKFPANFAVSLDASTVGGQISTSGIPDAVKNSPGSSSLKVKSTKGGPLLSLQTTGGNIQIVGQ